MLKILSLTGLFVYFGVLLFAVSREKKNENVMDYFFAGRSLPFWALSITFIASWWGAGSALSTADLAFDAGLGAFWYYGVPVLLATFLMILMARRIRGVGYLTQGEMMKVRYSKGVSKMLSVMILAFMTLSAASQMVGIGKFFGTYLGLNYEFAVILGTVIVLIYSVFGGFRGVVFTDIIQFVLLALSAFAVFLVAMIHAGGWTGIAEAAAAAGKTDFMSLSAGMFKYFMYVITFGCSWMIQANVWQRISAAKNNNDAKKMTILSFFAYVPLYLIVVLTGMAGFVLYDKLPKGGIVVGVVMDYMSPVIGAVVFIGISAAIMSTMDSLINTGAMTMSLDLRKEKGNDKEKLNFSRYATLGVTLAALLISLRIRSILDVSWIASDIITSGAFVPLLMGFVWRRGNSKGAMASMICGLVYSFYNMLIFLGVSLPAFWKSQSIKQVLIGVAVSFVLYVAVSLATPAEKDRAGTLKSYDNI